MNSVEWVFLHIISRNSRLLMNITSTAKFAIGTLWEQLETDREISEMALENGRMVIISPISANEVERSTRRGRIKQDDRPAHPAELSTASREWLIAVRA